MRVWRRFAVVLILLAMNVGTADYAIAHDCQGQDESSQVVASTTAALTSPSCCTAVACSICAPLPASSAFPAPAVGVAQVLQAMPEIDHPSLSFKPADPPPRSA